MSAIKKIVKKLIPKQLLNNIRPVYHGIKANYNAKKFHNPAKNINIIAITGTKGKTTTTVFTGRLLNLIGHKTGYITTGIINLDGHQEYLNLHKMTTLDSYNIQKYLRKMVDNNCEYVILEMSSQGLQQNRHQGLGQFNSGLFLNIFPEHIEYHGSFENYLNSKALLFRNIKPGGIAVLNGQSEYSKTIVSTIPAKLKQTLQISFPQPNKQIIIEKNHTMEKSFTYFGKSYRTNLITDFDINNLFFAIQIIAKTLTKNTKEETQLKLKLSKLSSKLKPVSGRMEWVVKNGLTIFKKSHISSPKRKISILVDYAHEPESMKQLLQTIQSWTPDYFNNIIHIVSCDGAGRDDWKKPILATISQKYANISILTTDNYDKNDNPKKILELLEQDLDQKPTSLDTINI
ncbi:hypothetical protein HC864_00920 [Candidatus Gracilibacteria bacterium]|nr:hypothetical protein [Candidatus Gracilibacteria bacterium]